MRRVLLLVVDGCTSRVLGPAIESRDLPVMAALAAAGTLRLDCVSIFPSITPAATASIVTGCYPARHGITGMSWWNPDTDEISYFGEDVWTILQRGVSDYLRGFLVRLNGERLRSLTMFQQAERHHRRAACFNHLIFRGDVEHEVTPPPPLPLLPSLGSRLTVHGPSWLCLGDFVSSTGRRHVETSGGLFNRFGLDDEGTEEFLRDVPDAGSLPDFTVAYFADYDFDSHEQGPAGALETLRQLDGRLGRIFEHWGGLDRVLADTCIILTADHAHSDVRSDGSAGIALETVLADFRRADPGRGWQRGDELLLCPNMRAAEIYVRAGRGDIIPGVCDALLRDTRIDQVIWRETRERDGSLHIATRDRGELRIRRAPRGEGVCDEYGGSWLLDGDPRAVDASVEDGRIRYGVYPNALERVANGIDDPRAGRIWGTARPGYEFLAPGQSVHTHGGSHGTLHELDSLVPLLIAGGEDARTLPRTPRIVDVAPICAAVLGIPFDILPGGSHRPG